MTAAENGRAAPAPTWRELDREGCVYGQHVSKCVEDLGNDIKDLRAAQAKVTWALVSVAISFATAALLLLANLASRGLP